MEKTTYGDITPRTAGYAVKRLLTRGQHYLVAERFGFVDAQGKKKTKTRKWRRYHSLIRATAPLAEGVPPTGQKMRYTDYEVTLEQYGDVVPLTDVIEDTHEDDVLNENMDLCGEQMAETVEVLRFNVLKAGTNVVYANGATSRAAVNSPPKRGDFRKIIRSFNRNKAKEISKIIKASPNIATEPVAPAFFAMMHTDLKPDISNINGFTPVEKYSQADKALPGEVGKLDSIRFIATALVEPWETAGLSGTTYLSGGATVSDEAQCDVYPIIIVARDAYAIVPLQGKNAVKPYVINPGKVDKADPLGQIGFVGWKTYQAAAILNQLWICRYEVACTAEPI